MGWMKALFGRVMKTWSSKNKKSSSDSESSSTDALELTLRELNKATQSFSAASLIGRGRSNDTAVYRASLPIVGKSGKAAAVAKRLMLLYDEEFLRQQVLVLSRLRHDNVVRLLGYTIDATAGVRALLFEFADMGTLHDVLHGPPAAEPSSSRPALTLALTLSWEQRTGIALDVARGLEYLHNAAVYHCGIRSTNVLLFHGFRAKIADYDVFKQLPEEGRLRAGEESWYYPPEYIATGRRTRRFDVFSYGVLLMELLTGRKRCKASRADPLEWAAEVLKEGRVEGIVDPKLGTRYPPARALKLARIALCCVQKNPKSRPSMSDVAQMISCDIVHQ